MDQAPTQDRRPARTVADAVSVGAQGRTGARRRLRIVLANMYSMDVARRKYDAGLYPRHNLFGGLALEQAGHTVSYVDLPVLPDPIARITRKARLHVGDLQAEARTLRLLGGADVVVGLAETTLNGLALLRTAGLLRTPVCALFHERPSVTGLRPQTVRAYDLVFSLSRHTYAELLELGRDPDRTIHLRWGPDVDFAGYRAALREVAEEYVLSCGKTLRDIDTLAHALTSIGAPGLIYAPQRWQPPAGDRVQVRRFPPMPEYPDVMRDMARASVVAVPRTDPDRMAGVSELNDALALGKPVVMTRSPHIDFDIEEVGCGIFVEPGDVDGWRSALDRLGRDPRLRREMGARGRAFAERERNVELSDRQMVEALEALVA